MIWKTQKCRNPLLKSKLDLHLAPSWQDDLAKVEAGSVKRGRGGRGGVKDSTVAAAGPEVNTMDSGGQGVQEAIWAIRRAAQLSTRRV